MLFRRVVVHLAAALSLTLAYGVAAADVPTLLAVDVQSDTARARETIVLTFESLVPDLEVRGEPTGIKIRLPGSQTDIGAQPPIVLEQAADGVELSMERPGAKLDAVRIEGSTVRIQVSFTLNAGDGAGYRLGIGDIVTVSVYREPDLSGDFPILQDGAILMPLIGAVPASGISVSDLAARVRAMLSDYLVDPQVRAGVKEYQSQFVMITGAVAVAKRVPLRPGMTLKAVLSEAGVALGGGQAVILTRSDGEAIEMSITDLDRADAPPPRDGDVLTVQTPDSFFISGEVRRPGRYPYIPGLTLQQALVLAEGLTEWASRKEIRIQRQVGEQTVDEVVNLRKVQERKIPDPELRPGDLIVVRRRIL